MLDSSTPAITNQFVDRIYSKLRPVYDALFGAVLLVLLECRQPRRILASAA
jgi:hypothetical protein